MLPHRCVVRPRRRRARLGRALDPLGRDQVVGVRLYERLGFSLAEDKGVYLFLERPPVS